MSGLISFKLHHRTKVGASRKRSALVLPLVLGLMWMRMKMNKIEERIGLVAAGFRAQGAKFGWMGCHDQSSVHGTLHCMGNVGEA